MRVPSFEIFRSMSRWPWEFVYASCSCSCVAISSKMLPAGFHPSGSICVVRGPIVVERNSLYGDLVLGYETPEEDAVNIDQPEELNWARTEANACTKKQS